jgi:PASTA domain-containing protein
LTIGLAALTMVAVWIGASNAEAANSPTFRDCSFLGGIDPDFVQLSGTTMDSQGKLTAPAQAPVSLKASESSDPGDMSNMVTLHLTVSAPGAPSRTAAGSGTGHVTLAVGLIGSASGTTQDTISWAATFDNGSHSCPSSSTPQNTSPMPFVVNVPAGAGSCDVPSLRGRSLKAAKKALRAADCALGKVKGRRNGRVKHQKPMPGTVLAAGSRVNLKLG